MAANLPSLAGFLLQHSYVTQSVRGQQLTGQTSAHQRERVQAPSPGLFVPPIDSQDTTSELDSPSPDCRRLKGPDFDSQEAPPPQTPPRILIHWDELGSRRSQPKEPSQEYRFQLVGEPGTPYESYERIPLAFWSACLGKEEASQKQVAADALVATDSQHALQSSDSTAGAAAPLHSKTLQVQPEAAEDKIPLLAKADVQSAAGEACSSGRAGEEMTEEGQGKVEENLWECNAAAGAGERKLGTGDPATRERPAENSHAAEEMRDPMARQAQAEKEKECRDHDQEKVHESDQRDVSLHDKDDGPPREKHQEHAPPLEPEDKQACLKRPASAELAGQASKRARSSKGLCDAPEGNLDEPTNQDDFAALKPAEEDMVDAEAEDTVEDTRGPIWAGRICPTKPFWKQMFLMKKAVYEETVAKLQAEFGAKHAQRWKTNLAQRDFALRISEELREQGKSMGTLHDQDIQRSTEFVRVVADRWGEEKAEQFREEMGHKTCQALELIGIRDPGL